MSLAEIGPYSLLRTLAAGGQGSVYLAEDSRLERRVALKLRRLPRQPAARREALAEARTLAGFSDHRIVQLYDVVELQDAVALVMEYVPGSDLEQLLGIMEFEQGLVIQVGLALCSALAVAHANGVVHGDLKPANVLLSEEGQVKLSDFGVAMRGDGESGEGGSATAMAPEQLREGVSDIRSDLFALGCLVYRMLCGRHPFPAGHYLPGSEPLAFADCDREVHPALQRLVLELLQEDPARRPDSALQVRRELLAIARELPAGDAATLVNLATRFEELDVPGKATLPTAAIADARAGFWPRAALLTLPLLAAVLLVGAWLPAAQPGVRLGGVSVQGNPGLSEMRLTGILRAALQSRPELLPEEPGGGEILLTLRVHCNEYVCSSQLSREGPGGEQSDTRALLPGDPEPAWRRRVEQGMRELFP